MFIGQVYIFCGEMSIQVLGPIFNWVLLLLTFRGSLYIFDINPL